MEIHFTALPENKPSLQMIQRVKIVPATIPQAEQQQIKQKSVRHTGTFTRQNCEKLSHSNV
jgi:hypothetical protein